MIKPEYKTVKFAHNFNKFKHFDLNKPFQLIWAIRGFSAVLSDFFKEYDTYIDEDNYYDLPEDAIIILFFQQNDKLITTIRSFTQDDYNIWHSSEGNFFNFVVE